MNPVLLLSIWTVFAKLTKPVVQFLRQYGVQMILYLDDLLVAALNTSVVARHIHCTVASDILCFVINRGKNVTVPEGRLPSCQTSIHRTGSYQVVISRSSSSQPSVVEGSPQRQLLGSQMENKHICRDRVRCVKARMESSLLEGEIGDGQQQRQSSISIY